MSHLVSASISRYGMRLLVASKRRAGAPALARDRTDRPRLLVILSAGAAALLLGLALFVLGGRGSAPVASGAEPGRDATAPTRGSGTFACSGNQVIFCNGGYQVVEDCQPAMV